MRNRIDARTTILKILDFVSSPALDEDAVIFVIAAHQDDPRCGLRTAGKLMRFNTLIVSTRRAAGAILPSSLETNHRSCPGRGLPNTMRPGPCVSERVPVLIALLRLPC